MESEYETDADKNQQLRQAVDHAIAEDLTRFVERSFAVIENAGHSIRLIKRDDARQAISIPWSDLSSLRELITIILKDELPVKGTTPTPSEAAQNAAREIKDWLNQIGGFGLAVMSDDDCERKLLEIISRYCGTGDMK